MPISIEKIQNPLQRRVIALSRARMPKDLISRAAARMIEARGPVGTGRYACTCNNWGPRFIEDSQDGCCDGCFDWAKDHHYEVPTSDLDPNRVTREMIVKNTWGINVRQLDLNRAHKIVDKALDGYPVEGRTSTWDWAPIVPEDGAGIKRDPDVPSFFDNLDWIGEYK